MNEIEYDPGEIRPYEREIWRQGLCYGLAKVSFIDGKVNFDSSGHININEYVKSITEKSLTARACKIISVLRKIIESKIKSDDYLIGEDSICLESGKIWINAGDQRVKLLPQKSDTDFFDRLCLLCSELGGDNIRDRLITENNKSHMSEQDLLRFLSLFELELRQ